MPSPFARAETAAMCLGLGLLTLMAGCGSGNRLAEYHFQNRNMTAVMAPPPRAQIFTESFYTGTDGNAIARILKAGTIIAKQVEVHKARKRLDTALTQVDIPERIRIGTLNQCAGVLGTRPVESGGNTPFILRMEIREYGIEAKSWDSSVFFTIHMKVRLIDEAGPVEIWEKTFREKLPVTESVFGLGESAGNVITAVALADLDETEITEGFNLLAEYTAGRIAAEIGNDLLKSRTDRKTADHS